MKIEKSKIEIISDEFYGLKFCTSDPLFQKAVTKLSKKLGIFLLVTYSGVKFYTHEDKNVIEQFKKEILLMDDNS